ncbi:MAG: sterol desaturase family protein [Polyangiaceae bacterium]
MRTEWVDNVSLGMSRALFELATRGVQLGIYEAVQVGCRAPVLDAGTASTWLLAVAGYDFLYYWAHRAQHRSGLLWATHAVHHQATEMNVTVGLRSAVTNSFAHLPFFLPLAAVGVPTSFYLGVTLIHLVAMTWLHTTKVGHLGWLERWINTPMLHGVHHSASREDADRNFGGLVIVWDRLFGTYAAPTEVERFGVIGQTEAPGPIAAHLEPYRHLFASLRAAPSLPAKLRALVL